MANDASSTAMTDPHETNTPGFEHPPVEEVALCVYVAPLVAVKAVHLGLLWQEAWAEELPNIEEQPETPAVPLETIESSIQPLFQFVMGSPVPRVVMSGANETEFVQVQRDRIVHNWRKTNVGEAYPRYRSLKPAFEHDVTRLSEFLGSRSLGTLQATQCEVAYVNPFTDLKAEDLAELVEPWTGVGSDPFLDSPDDGQINLRYPLLDSMERRLGHLYLTVASVKRQDGQPIVLLTSMARYAVLDEGMSAIMSALDRAHDAAVRGFVSFTTAAQHREWGGPDA